MGCAMQEHQDQQTNGLIKMDLSACCQRITGGEQQRQIAANKSPSPQLHPQQNNQKHSQLKESHSALVKILESAPIKQKSPTAPALISGDGNSQLAAAIVNNSHSSESRHLQYRKRVKHSICDNHDRNSSGDDDDQSSIASVDRTPAGGLSTAAEVLCPWKKTRIAREWRQKKETVQDGAVAVDAKLPLTGGMERMVIDDGDDEQEDEDEDVDSSCECGNKLSWRRVSSDSNDSCLSHQHNDSSSCDSDCLENISDLCKKFNENLSENDGFFRRSIQQKIQYRPCTKNQQCSILRINRNRCQYCRLKKCIAVGMSRDAVRFGRVPKREKARILAAMQQSTQNRGHQRALTTELDDQPRLLASVLRAHMETCEFTKEKVTSMRHRARECPAYSMPTLACPLNPAPELQSEQEFSQRFAHVIRGVIDFAGMIPGFQVLTQDDKFTLLKAGLFDALFVRLICMFDSSMNSIICLNGQVMRRDSIQNGANARFLVDSTFNFSERMNAMNLSDAEIGLFCAIVLITPDRPGLRNLELIEKMYARLKSCLQTVITQNRPNEPDFMAELLKLLPDLRTLSTLHTEKLVVFRTEHKELLRQQMWQLDDDARKSPGSSSTSTTWGCSNDQLMEEVAKSPMGSVSSTESSDTAASEYSQSLSASAPLLAATLSGGCPLRLRANSGSSAEDDIVGTAHLTQNGLTITPVVRSTPVGAHHIRYRKLDSPTDSGIESGNEKADHKTASSSESSSCSSPRSSVEDITEDKRHIVEDMPVLKRVLQAPPLYDTNSLMDEAYKPHKKFRALRHRESDAEADAAVHHLPTATTSGVAIVPVAQPPQKPQQSQSIPQQQPQSQLHMHLTRPQQQQQQQTSSHHHHQHLSHQLQQHQPTAQTAAAQPPSSLSSTHSVLARSLMEEPRMTPEQMKRSDIIHNYIKRESQAEQQQQQQQNHHHQLQAGGYKTAAQGLLVCATTTSPAPAQCPFSGRWSNASASSSSSSNASSNGLSVITTTPRHQLTPSPNGSLSDHHSNHHQQRYFQSPHSTSTSPPRPSPSSVTSPRLLELQVDIADAQQPLNLSKKSPSPPPAIAAAPSTTVTVATSSQLRGALYKVKLEA